MIAGAYPPAKAVGLRNGFGGSSGFSRLQRASTRCGDKYGDSGFARMTIGLVLTTMRFDSVGFTDFIPRQKLWGLTRRSSFAFRSHASFSLILQQA
jgi:hypothetical protein